MAVTTSAPSMRIRDEVTALKRARTIAAAVDLFYDNGYENTTLDAVAERLGVTKPFIYAHFSSKTELLAEICSRGIATSLEAIRPTTPRSGSSALMACCNSASSAGQGGIWMCCKGPRRRDWSRSSRICSVRPGRAGGGAGCCMVWSGWVARGSVRQRRGTASRCRRSSVHAVEAARKS